MNPEEITRENLGKINIKEIALNKERFGTLTFESVIGQLEKMQRLFVELEELGYKEDLSQPEINDVDSKADRFITYLKQLASFNLSTGFNNSQHEQFITTINQIYDDTLKSLRDILVYLRQEAELKDSDKKQIRDEQKEVVKLRKQLEGLVESLGKEREKIQAETTKIETAKGERAAVRFGKHFEFQSTENSDEAKKWLRLRNIFFWTLVVVIVSNVLGYFGLFIGNKINSEIIAPSSFFTLEYGLTKLALISVLSYAVAFSSRNFNVNSNLSVLNTHRKNVAETLSDFLDTDLEKEDRSKIVESATEAMFRHQPIGYLPKIESRDDGPVASIVNTILKQN